MNIDQLRKKVRVWDQMHSGDPVARAKYGLILDQIEYHARREWRVYRPAEHPASIPTTWSDSQHG